MTQKDADTLHAQVATLRTNDLWLLIQWLYLEYGRRIYMEPIEMYAQERP